MSEPCGSLPCMASDDPRAATVTDPDGREVVLLARIWAEKIADDHPELIDHRDAVIQTVSKPDHVEPDAPPNPRNPNATPSASRCGAGRLFQAISIGAHNCCRAANASSISEIG